MTREERIEELEKLVDLEERQIKDKLEEIFRNAVGISNVGATCYRHTYRKELRGEVFIIDRETKEEVFGASVDFCINNRSNCLEINYGSIGNHDSHDRNSAYKYKDILIGEMWRNENNLMVVYNNIDWTNLEELAKLINEIEKEESAKRRAEAEEKAKQERIELDEVLTHLHEDKIIRHSINDFIRIVIKKIGRKNITLYDSICYNHKWTKVIEKYAFAKYLIDKKFLWKTN